MDATQQHSIASHNDRHLHTDSISPEQFERLRRIAFWSCVISFIFDIALGFTAFVDCIRTKSFVGFSYSVHTFMDSLCTSFVSWHLMATTIHDSHRRDILACCVIGALFIGSFLAIESRAIQSMLSPPTSRPEMIGTVVAVYSYIHIVVFTILSIIKIRISKQIRSKALKFDTLNSIIGIIMVLPLIVWDRVVFINKFAHLDDLIQALMALFLFLAGGKLILDSITIMNTEYARKIRKEKLKKMLKESDDDDADNDHALHGANPNHFVGGT